MNACRILVFAKAPRAGRVKTRLIPALGDAGAAALAARLLERTLQTALHANIGPVELCRSPADDPLWRSLCLPAGIDFTDQGDGDLGQRMQRAGQRHPDTALLYLGTDCPALDPEKLRAHAAALTQYDATLTPAHDGGYVALGLRRYHPSVFDGIRWSTATVADATRQRIAALGWTLEQFAAEHDVDEAADLQWLPTDCIAVQGADAAQAAPD